MKVPKDLPGDASVDFLLGGGEMGERMRKTDWSRTPLGHAASWPRSLKTSISIMLASRFAMVIAWGPDFRFFYNDRYRPVLGATKHPGALGTPAAEIFPEAWPFIGPLFESTRSGEAVALDDVLIPLDRNGYLENCYFTLSYSPIRDESGGVGGMLAVVAETTERLESERRFATLRELSRHSGDVQTPEQAREQAMATLASNPIDIPFALFYLPDETGTQARLVSSPGLPPDSPASVSVVDLSARGLAWPLAESIESRQLVILQDLPQRFGQLPGGPYPEPTHTAAIAPLLRPGQTRPDAVLVFGVSPRRAFDDSYRGFFELAADHILTAIRNALAYQEERQRTEALAELDRAKTEFFSNVSHEFRTPLTLMLGPLEELLNEPQESVSGEARQHLQLAHRNSLRLLKLVNTLLDFSRIEAGRVEAVYEQVDLATITSDLASVFRSAIEKAHLTFIVNCPPLDREMYVDREMWEKIVFNLLSNAFKFTFEGSIEIGLRLIPGDNAELFVRDTGTGIPASDLPHLFERFHRVRQTRGRSQEGTGIGLALVQELVRLHGGTVSVESELNRGSTFFVRLPTGAAHLPADRIGAARSKSSTGLKGEVYIEEALRWLPEGTTDQLLDIPPESPQPVSEESTRYRILLADDNADMRDYVARLLSQRFRVESVTDGLAALRTARRHRPDLILSDIMMTGLDGFGLLRAVRSDPELRTIPVILLSARAGEEARVEGIAAGADDYLVKPFSARELMARVETHLAMMTMRQESERTIRGLQEELQDQVEDLQLTNEHLRLATQAGKVGIWNWDVQKNHITWTDSLYEIHGIAPGQFDGTVEGFAKLVHPDDSDAVGAAIQKSLESGDRYEIEFRAIRPSGEVIWLFTTGMVIRENGIATRMIGSAVDISERRRTDAVLRESEQRERARAEELESARDQLEGEREILQVLNRSGQILAAELDLKKLVQALTDAATEITGAQAGAYFYNVVNKEGSSYLLYALSGVPREKFATFPMPRSTNLFGPTFRGEGIVRIADVKKDPRYGNSAPYYGMPGGHIPVSSYLAVPVISRSGEVLGGLFFGHEKPGVFTDSHERIVKGLAAQAAIAIDNAQLYETARKARFAAETANRLKDEFLATVSHELRTPLNAILGWSRLLRSGKLEDEKKQQALEIVERNAMAQQQIIEDILDVSRIITGKLRLEVSPVEISTVLEAAIDSIKPSAEAKGVRLQPVIPSGGNLVLGDPNRLQQIIWNLLSNAVKFTPRGGRVQVTLQKVDSHVEVTVRDTGQGISKEFLPYVFERFLQADSSSTRQYGGLGLGLAIVRHLTELNGGTVSASSPGENMGATFVVRLPLAIIHDEGRARTDREARLDLQGAATRQTPRFNINLAGIRVLAVDDEADARELLSVVLSQRNATVKVVASAREALQAIADWKPDVVISDIGMSEEDGYSLIRKVRALPPESGGKVPAAALTAYARSEDRVKALAAGYQTHVTKPVDPFELAAVVASLAGRSSAASDRLES